MHARLVLLPLSLCLGAFLQVHAANFTFSYGAATECGDFALSWTGGSGPFTVTLAPEFGSQRVLNIPDTSFSGGKGSFDTQLPFEKDHKFLAIMSDATGFGSGGVSGVIQIGAAVGSAQCNTTDPGVDFTYTLDDALAQCRQYRIAGYTQAVQPVTIFGIVPGGNSIILNPPVGPSVYPWIADASAGTSMMFIVQDSQGRKGGCSDVRLVAQSEDKSCIGGNSPMSVSNAPQATQSSDGSTPSSSTSPVGNDAVGKKTNTGAIIGGVLAGLFGILTFIALALFFWRRHQRGKADSYYGGGNGRGSRRKTRTHSMDLDPPASMSDDHAPMPVVQPFPYTPHGTEFSPSSHSLLSPASRPPTQYSAVAPSFQDQVSPSEYSTHSRPAGSSVGEHGRMNSVSSSGRTKASMAASMASRPTRFIVHSDIEEALPQDETEEVVELPPQYSERRAPLPQLQDSGAASNSSPLEHRRGNSSAGLQPPLEPRPGNTYNHS